MSDSEAGNEPYALKEILIDVNAPPVLNQAEREEVRKMLTSASFRKYLSCLELKRPSSYCGNDFGDTPELKTKNESNRVREMLGWDQYKAALTCSANEPQRISKEVQAMPEEQYGAKVEVEEDEE